MVRWILTVKNTVTAMAHTDVQTTSRDELH